jgi:hypothetical protein
MRRRMQQTESTCICTAGHSRVCHTLQAKKVMRQTRMKVATPQMSRRRMSSSLMPPGNR